MRKLHHRTMGFVAFLATVLALFAPMAPSAFAIGGAVVVKSLADTDDAAQHNCTLREALQGISLYHASPNDGTKATYHECTGIHPTLNAITFSVSGTIKPASSLPDVSSNIALTGPIIIDGSANANSPIFRVSTSDAIFSIAGITVTKAEPAILMTSGQAMLNIAGSSFVGNTAITNGGAIDATGKVNIAGTNFTGNTAPNGAGGAINMTGGDSQLNIGGSVFNGNTAKHTGGAIMLSTPANIADTIFNGNIAQGIDPDGDGTDGDPNDEDLYFTMGGGALFITNTSGHDGKVEIIRSVFNGNLAAPKANAGALYSTSGAVVEVRDSSFNGNLSGSTGFDRLGGAILTAGATLSLNRVTLLNNGVTGDGGGIAIDRGNVPVNLTNVTIVANAATGKGGGIYAFNTQQNGSSNIRTDLTIRNATISLNASTDGGGIYGMAPSSSHPEPHKLANTIFADNVPANCAGGPFTTLGHNLDSAASCALTGNGDLQAANAALEGPFFNGGPLANLLTQKLGPGSAALDGGDPAICAADPVGNVDQRSESRGGDGDGNGIGGCDIGAYEGGTVKAGYASIPVQPGPIDVGNVQLGTSGQTSFSIISTGNKDLEVSAQLQGAGAGEFGIVTFPSTVSTQAIATISCTPTGNPGTRTTGLVVTTNDPDHPSVAYELQCNATAVPVAGYGSTPAAPGPLSIGPVLVGQSKSTTLTIMETGNATLEANTPVLGGLNPSEFSAAVNVTIADGGAAVLVQVSCTPTAPGIRSATLTFSTNDPTQPTVIYNLACTATVPPNPVLADPTAFDGLGINTMTGPYGEAFSPDGRHLYVASTNGVVTVFERNTETGGLGNPIQSFTDPNGFLAGAIRVIVSPNGENVYVSAATASRILAYSRDTNSGLLTPLDNVVEGEDYGCFPLPCTGPVYGLQSAYGMAISSDNRFLYVSGYSDSTASGDNKTIVMFNLLGDGGLQNVFNDPIIAAFTTHADLKGTYDLTLSPDGAHLYAANYLGNPDSIVVFSRNPSTGALTHVQTLSQSAVASLNGVFRLTFSPDGQYAYTSSYDGNAITVLKRNAADGTLSFVAAYTDGGQDDIGQTLTSLAQSSSAVVSPDGRYLFTASHGDHALNVFERSQETGQLTFVEDVLRNPSNLGQAGTPPLGNARDVVLAGNGRHLYVSGFADDQIVFLPFANPLPTLTSLSPASTLAGSGPTVVTVNGNDFVESSVAIWNNAIILDDEFVSSSEVRVTLPADLLATPGSGTITVINLGPGGGTSNGLSFTIGAPATSTTPADNPVPSIEQIGPQGAVAGGPSLLVTVNGSGFLPSSVVNWNGEARQTTYISSSTLQFQTTIADVAQPGTSVVTVVNPAPGGGTSNAVGFTVAAPGENPPPSLDHISPASLVDGEGGGLLVINVYGAGFVEGAVARWDGTDRPTTFVSDTELRLELNGADVAGAGQRSVTVFNPAPGGGESNAVPFTVVAIGENPLPTLGRARFQSFNTDGSVNLTVTGAGFVAGTQVRWNGADRATSVTSATELVVTISAADYTAGSAVLTAQNPAPGGGGSNELLFSLIRLALPLVMR